MLPERMFTTFQTAARGLELQREKISVASMNMANASVTAPPGRSGHYRPREIVVSGARTVQFRDMLQESVSSLRRTHPAHFESSEAGRPGHFLFTREQSGAGPEFRITEIESFRLEYDPGHPDADENGMVTYPDVDLIREMTRLASANRLYEANLSSIEAEKEIIRRSLDI
jgi:flagellar basal-body rod protein FlgC